MSFDPGSRIGPYEILGSLGAGGMGEVYRALDTRLRREVALKRLPEAFAQDRERLARFEREAQSLAALNHPHIAQVFGYEQWDGVRVIAMELVEGPTLGERITAPPLARRETLAIAQQLADALEAAHDRGIVHRDLKPSNIKVTDDGAVKVLDFGLAKMLEGSEVAAQQQRPSDSPTITSPAVTHMGVVLGTAAYMSPEQARGRPADRRADIWAFGCVVFEMLVGRRLFDAATTTDTIAAVLREPIPWQDLPADTPPALRLVLERCLDRDVRTRLRDIGEARIALERSTSAPGPVAPDRGLPMRRWLVAAAWVAAIAAAAVVGRLTARPASPAAADRPVKMNAVVAAPGAPILEAAIAPDGRSIVYQAAGQLWLQRFDEWQSRELPDSKGGYSPFWSPDGDWIAYFTDSKLIRTPVSGATRMVVCDLPTNAAGGSWNGAWEEDGNIVMAFGGGPVLRVPSQGGAISEALAVVDGVLDYHQPAVLPGRDEIVVLAHRTSGVDTIGVVQEGTWRPLVQVSSGTIGSVVYSPTGHLVYHRTSPDPSVWAVPFSLSSLTTSGEPFLVLPGVRPSVSKDGALTAVVAPERPDSELVWVTPDGKRGAIIAAPRDAHDGVSISVDGQQLAYADASGIWSVALESGARSRLTSHVNDLAPRWLGRDQIAFTRIENGESFVLIKRADPGAAERVIAARERSASVSADGRYLVFNRQAQVRTSAGQWDAVWAETSSLDTIHELGKAHAGARFPDISPDGQWVLYMSAESGREEVYLTRFPSGEGKWQISAEGGNWPRWGLRPGELIYRNAKSEMMAVTITGSVAPRISAPRKLFDWPRDFANSYAAGTNGRLVAFAFLPGKPLTSAVRIVTNWASEGQSLQTK